MSPPHDPTPSGNPVDDLIASYVQAVEAGQVPDRREYLDRNPDHAEALRDFFADFDRMVQVAAPLRMAGDLDETAAVDVSGLTRLPTVRYFGDYELLEEVARGGMGVVYKARQTSLNRLVALKMILAGTFATPREVARFQAEAEAAANLDHPGIVPVYEVGEHDGQQYFSMKFIEGGSLAGVPRADIKTEVLGLIAIARAVHHAHQHGVLHRDLKPSNVLVDPQGDRHVTDFGLAKRLAEIDRSLTEAGQILGTPRYMSPEQALGRKDLTVAADVYALGVILYERLTGRTPFEAESALDLLRQVREAEPPRPSGLDRDLETIVLKALEKDPARRYPTAREMVEDLTRWLEGRPINARPVGQGERFVRWCRRNPVVAGLSASVGMALILGAVISSLFAFQERKARIRAETAEDKTERAFARSLVRPLNIKGIGVLSDQDFDPVLLQKPDLSEPEVEALWELAGEVTGTLKDRFLEVAVSEPLTLRQLQARSEPALVAALGLDPDRRAKADAFLFDRIRRPDVSIEGRVDLSFLLLQLEDKPDPRFDPASMTILQAWDENPPSDLRTSLETKLAGSLGWISTTRAADLVVSRIGRHDGRPRRHLEILDRLIRDKSDPADSAIIARAIARSFDMVKDTEVQISLAYKLADLLDRLDPAEAASLCGPVVRSLSPRLVSKEMIDLGSPIFDLANSLARLAVRLKAGETREICGPPARAIAQTLEKNMETNKSEYFSLNRALATLTAPLDKAEAAEICAPVARLFVQTIEREPDRGKRLALAQLLVDLSGRIPSTEVVRVASVIAKDLAKEVSERYKGQVRGPFCNQFVSLTSQLNKADAAAVWGPVASSLVEEIRRQTDVVTIQGLVVDLESVADQLDPIEAAQVCGSAARSFAECIGRDKDTVRSGIDETMSLLARRLDPAGAATLARSLARTIGNETNKYTRCELAELLASLSVRLQPDLAAELCGPIALSFAQVLPQETSYIRHLGKLSRHVDLSDARTISKRIAEATLRESVSLSGSYSHLYELPGDLVSYSLRLTLTESDALCGPICRSIAQAFAQEKRGQERAILALSLALVSACIDQNEASQLCGRVARSVADDLEERSPSGFDGGYDLTEILHSLMVRLQPSEAAITARSVLRAIEQRKDAGPRAEILKAFPTLIGRIDPAETLSIARSIADAIGRETDAGVQWGLAKALVSLSSRPQNERTLRFVATVLQFGPGAATVREASEPKPISLSTQEYVDLLKMPTLIGEARRVVLDELGNIHGRRFANHWEFVRFARESGLKLDFTTPPRRPDPQASHGRLLDDLPTGR